jgi:hypothetical protein
VSVNGKVPIRRWSSRHRAAAKQLSRALTDGVGLEDGQGFLKWGAFCLHRRKLLTDEEIGLLDPDWLALPAIDEAG